MPQRTNELDELRAEIAALGAVKHLRRYPAELRRRIAKHARRRREAGESQASVAKVSRYVRPNARKVRERRFAERHWRTKSTSSAPASICSGADSDLRQARRERSARMVAR